MMPNVLAVLLGLLLVACSGAAEVRSIDLAPRCPTVPRGPGAFEIGLAFGNPPGKASIELTRRRPESQSRDESPRCSPAWRNAEIRVSL